MFIANIKYVNNGNSLQCETLIDYYLVLQRNRIPLQTGQFTTFTDNVARELNSENVC